MKYLFVLVFLLSGCATQTTNPWTDLEVSRKAAATPVDCGSFPMPSEVHMTGDAVLDENSNGVMRMDRSQLFYDVDEIVYDNAAMNDLEAYRACSEANKGIAAEHAQQIDQLRIATQGLVEAGKAQRNIADMRQEMLEDERKHNFFMTIVYWGAIAVLGIAL